MNQSEIINILCTRDQTLVDYPSELQETPLMIGCLAGHIAVVQCLLHLGANPHTKAPDGSTVVHYAASSGVADVLGCVLQLRGMTENVNSMNSVSNEGTDRIGIVYSIGGNSCVGGTGPHQK